MHTNNENESDDSKERAYGRMVQELLSQSRASTWIHDLWDMYTGYTLYAQKAGYDPQGHDKFVSFKTMVFFFQEIEKMEKGE